LKLTELPVLMGLTELKAVKAMERCIDGFEMEIAGDITDNRVMMCR
jgi:hypothetical protein